MILKTIVLASAITIAGVMSQVSSCSTSTTTPTIVLSNIQAIAVAACQFSPALDTVNQVLNANKTLQNATAIADAVCALVKAANVTPAPSAAANATDHQIAVVPYNGQDIKIIGHFVPKS